MSTAALFFEAVDTAIALGHAFVGWLIFFAVVFTILVLAVIATGAWAVDAVRGRQGGRRRTAHAPEAPRGPREAHNAPQSPSRSVPSWARTDHHDDQFEEAA